MRCQTKLAAATRTEKPTVKVIQESNHAALQKRELNVGELSIYAALRVDKAAAVHMNDVNIKIFKPTKSMSSMSMDDRVVLQKYINTSSSQGRMRTRVTKGKLTQQQYNLCHK